MKVQLFKSNDVFREYDKPFGGDWNHEKWHHLATTG
jgi:hypothetical protein